MPAKKGKNTHAIMGYCHILLVVLALICRILNRLERKFFLKIRN